MTVVDEAIDKGLMTGIKGGYSPTSPKPREYNTS